LQEALLRVAHRHGLLMSAPELAEHLRAVCGPSLRWRDGEGDTGGPRTGTRGAGTEIYEGMEPPVEGTEKIDVDDLDDGDLDGLISVVQRDAGGPIFDERKKRQVRQHTSITNLSRLQGLELTSMINISGIADHAGARPLVDLEDDMEPAPPPRRPRPESSANLPLHAEDSVDNVAPVRGPEPAGPPLAEPPERRVSYRPWLVITLILLAGIGVAAAIGLSGPKLGSDGPGAVDTPEQRR
jgi:hypothetical protein